MQVAIRGPHQTVFCAGLNLIFLHYLLARHLGVAFRHAEVAILVLSLSYFAGISLGYWLSHRINFRTLQFLVLPYLAYQLAILAFAQSGIYILQEETQKVLTSFSIPLYYADLFCAVAVALLIIPAAGALVSLFLPLSAQGKSSELPSFYAIELCGSLIAALLLPILANIDHQSVLAAYVCSFLLLLVALAMPNFLICCSLLIGATFLRFFTPLDHALATWFYQKFYSGRGISGVAYSTVTPYHKIEVLNLPDDEYFLVLNGKKQFGPSSHYTYSYYMAEFPARLLDNQPQVALLGAGSMSSIGRIGSLMKSVVIADIDREVFETSSRFFQKYNQVDSFLAQGKLKFVSDDAKHFLAQASDSFDLILHDIPPAKSRQLALTYTEEFMHLVKQRLSSQGIFSLPCLRPAGARDRYARSILATVNKVFEHYVVLATASSFYVYAGNSPQLDLSPEVFFERVKRSNRSGVQILTSSDIRALVADAPVVTINSLAELVYE